MRNNLLAYSQGYSLVGLTGLFAAPSGEDVAVVAQEVHEIFDGYGETDNESGYHAVDDGYFGVETDAHGYDERYRHWYQHHHELEMAFAVVECLAEKSLHRHSAAIKRPDASEEPIVHYGSCGEIEFHAEEQPYWKWKFAVSDSVDYGDYSHDRHNSRHGGETAVACGKSFERSASVHVAGFGIAGGIEGAGGSSPSVFETVEIHNDWYLE